jgi:hypothetical protein
MASYMRTFCAALHTLSSTAPFDHEQITPKNDTSIRQRDGRLFNSQNDSSRSRGPIGGFAALT